MHDIEPHLVQAKLESATTSTPHSSPRSSIGTDIGIVIVTPISPTTGCFV